MPKETKKGTKLRVPGQIRRRVRHDVERARQERKQVPLTIVKTLRKSCFLRCEQLGKNGNKLDRKQYKLPSGPYDQY